MPFEDNFYIKSLKEEYDNYYEVFSKGNKFNILRDGAELNLIRSKIIFCKLQIENFLKMNFHLYPHEYFYPLPKRVRSDLVTKTRKVENGVWENNCDFGIENVICFSEQDLLKVESWKAIEM